MIKHVCPLCDAPNYSATEIERLKSPRCNQCHGDMRPLEDQVADIEQSVLRFLKEHRRVNQ